MNNKISLLSIVAIAAIGSFALMSFSSQDEIKANDLVIDTVHGTMQNYSVEELSQGTPFAIIGKVTQITPVLVDTEIGEKVFSDVTVKVQKDLNDAYDQKEITVRVLGGEAETIKTISHFSPTFEKNEKVLFFVADKEPNSIYGDNYYVAGVAVGKYRIHNDKAVKSADPHETENLDDLVEKIKKSKGLK